MQDDSVFQLEALFNTNMTTSHGLSSSGPIAFLFYSCTLFFKHILKHISIQIKQRTLEVFLLIGQKEKRVSQTIIRFTGEGKKASETEKRYDQRNFSTVIMRE